MELEHADITLNACKKAHFIGIGGAGMSGIALVLSEKPCQVSGSDLKESRYVRALRRAGIDVRIGHTAQNIDSIRPDVCVTSTAIPADNPELLRAQELGIPVWPRAKMLSELGRDKKTIAIAGTHGKTTTSSMVASMLSALDLDPSFLVGGIVEGFDTNGKNGNGECFVAEADESDASFLYLDPEIAVVTNIEADHLDHYKNLQEIEDTFCKFMASVPASGTVIVCAENPHVVDLARKSAKHVLTYGTAPNADFVVKSTGESFTVTTASGEQATLTLTSSPGIHNHLNATAALAVAHVLGVDLATAASALSHFKGARRRFTKVGEAGDISVIDDYGHHPTEIKATLAAAKAVQPGRLCVVFQPHRYSRVESLLDEFAKAFSDADCLYIIDIFSAGEMPIPGVTSKRLADIIQSANPQKTVVYLDNRATVAEKIANAAQPGDMIMTMGAGDVTLLAPEILEALVQKLNA